MEIIKVGLVEDDSTIRSSLETSIGLNPSMNLAFSEESVEDTLTTISRSTFEGVDIILQDIGLPGMSGIEGLKHIRKIIPDVDIIMLTTYDDTDTIFNALVNGARSYISKKTSLKVIMDSIFTVYRGGAYMSPSIARKIVEHLGSKKSNSLQEQLTNRQMEIVKGLSDGLSYKMLAEEFEISIDTVRSHIKNIYKTLEINNKVELINLYRQS